MWMITSFLYSCTSILFPSRCFDCGKKGETLCAKCIATYRKTLNTPHPYIFSLFDFREKAIKHAMHAIKYYHRKDLIQPLARTLAEEFKKTNNQLPLTANWTLVPIPMPTMRKLFRGYNQAELIALALGKELSLPVKTDLLKRSRTTKRQVMTSAKSERVRNQKGTFALEKSPAGMRILLIDDITTTGATIEEARKTILSGGASNVLAITVAH